MQDDDNDTVLGDGAHDEHEWMNAKTLVKPDDQLQLTDEVAPSPLHLVFILNSFLAAGVCFGICRS